MIFKIIEGIPDYAEIIDLINAEWPVQFGEKSDSEKIADMRESHDVERDRTVYIYDDSKIIGFYRYTAWPRAARITETAHIYDIAVLPSMQKQGIGMLLMDNLVDDCRKQGFKKLLSRSFRTNEGSIRLHKAAGFGISLETDDSIVWEIPISSK
ncbi:MAG TPA: hypothetical protein DCO79_13420 [Spirochaeta sp.]|nr:hypothetical protein [Spirochaeta sp.]